MIYKKDDENVSDMSNLNVTSPAKRCGKHVNKEVSPSFKHKWLNKCLKRLNLYVNNSGVNSEQCQSCYSKLETVFYDFSSCGALPIPQETFNYIKPTECYQHGVFMEKIFDSGKKKCTNKVDDCNVSDICMIYGEHLPYYETVQNMPSQTLLNSGKIRCNKHISFLVDKDHLGTFVGHDIIENVSKANYHEYASLAPDWHNKLIYKHNGFPEFSLKTLKVIFAHYFFQDRDENSDPLYAADFIEERENICFTENHNVQSDNCNVPTGKRRSSNDISMSSSSSIFKRFIGISRPANDIYGNCRRQKRRCFSEGDADATDIQFYKIVHMKHTTNSLPRRRMFSAIESPRISRLLYNLKHYNSKTIVSNTKVSVSVLQDAAERFSSNEKVSKQSGSSVVDDHELIDVDIKSNNNLVDDVFDDSQVSTFRELNLYFRKKAVSYKISSDAGSRRTSPDGTSGIRRRALSLSTPHRGSDVNVDPENSLRLFRHHRSLPLKNQFIESYGSAKLKKIEDDEIFVKFFEFHKCYDLIPNSAKLVVFDTQLLVKKAFFALLYNGVRAAPLWDSVKQKFVGMLTITDFIRILQMLYVSQDQEMEELEEHKLETWRSLLDDVKELVYVNPDDSLLDAIHALICNKIHRLPIIDPINGNVLYIVTHKRILKFLFLYIRDLPQPDWVSKSIGDLGIGSYDNVIIATHKMPIIEALGKFINHRISALPIVDEVTGRLIDIYAKFDVINLAAEKIYANLDVTLKSANEHRNEWFEGVHSCLRSDSLMAVMLKLVETEVHRLIVVDEGSLVVGVISLSDILSFLVLQPELRNLETKKEKSASCSPASEAAGVCDYLSSFVVENDTILEADEDKTSIAESVTPTMIFPEPIRKDDAGLSCFQASSKMDKEDIEPISLAPISL